MSRLPFTLTSLMTPEVKEKAMPNVLTVNQLVESVKRDVESNYRLVHVIGEVSSFKPWRSGHWYFDLKDEFALLPCVMFKGLTTRVPFEVKDGLQIIVTAKVSVYALQSKIQLVVERIEPCGVGALALAFEQLKAKLESEGLFSAAKKKTLNPFPKVVGIVTSPQGAALADMLRVLRNRMPSTRVLLAPCRVQGQGSASEIATALSRLDASGECDVIIVGRGGGSLEDLWSFNDEALARVIAGCQTPIVSAVGHETDFTIADFVADIRAATPTHAATTVVPKVEDVLNLLTHQNARIENAARAKVRQSILAIERLARRLGDPRMLVLRSAQRIDELLAKARGLMQRRRIMNVERTEHLRRRLDAASPMSRVGALSRRFKILSQRFSVWQPAGKVAQVRHRLERAESRLHDRIALIVRKNREKLRRDVASLNALSPLAVMGRGYAIAYKDNAVVMGVDQVAKGDDLKIRLRDGIIYATVLAKDEQHGE